MDTSYNYKSKKVVAILSNAVEAGVALNIVSHLCISLGHFADSEIMGRDRLLDASGTQHLGISRYPVIITQVKSGTIRKAIHLARQNAQLLVTDFPRQMLDTGHDDELAAAIQATSEQSIEYLGAVIYGPSKDVDAITGKYSLWR